MGRVGGEREADEGKEGMIPGSTIVWRILSPFSLPYSPQTFRSKVNGIDPRRSIREAEAYPKVKEECSLT